MAVGIKSSDLFHGLIKPEDARLCEDCAIVVAALKCPLCDVATVSHPDADLEPKYCAAGCGDEIPAGKALVVPWTHDPHQQDEDGDLVCLCPQCAKEEMGD